MKTFKTTTPKVLIAGFMLAGLMTGCSGNNDDNSGNNTPAPSSTASESATAAPSPAPTSTTDALAVPTVVATDKTVTPAIDFKTAVAAADASVAKNFPASTFNVEEGVRQGIAGYQKISEISNLHVARKAGDPADSAYADQNRDLFTATYLPTLKTQMDHQAPFPTANADGTITIKKTGTIYQSSGSWTTKYSSDPAIKTLSIEGVGVTLLISGVRLDTVITTTKQMLNVKTGYQIAVVPQADGSWKIAGIGSELLTESVTDAQ